MDDAIFRRADALLDAALDLPPSERAAFLDRECGGETGLRERVESLLRHIETAPGFLAPGGTQAEAVLGVLGAIGADDVEAAGRIIGAYRIEREIGRGGMAVVYLASRADGHFDQKVALKLINAGRHGEETIRRFGRERQILARAVHPNIARLFDGGLTSDGRPWFAMEHVAGEPIDAYCDRKGLPVNRRLALFLRVASAVAYAHRNLVVHRDIKPANILVSEGGEVKLLDFGIAKPLGSLEDETTLTRMGSHPMTPSFASPEQIRGEAVTTAVDIYQLGVLLYLLLCGKLPFAAHHAGDLAGLQRAILEDAPRPPSSCASEGRAEIAGARRATLAALARELSGDLDNIVLKALRKEPERRYAAATQLIDDVESYLAGRTVSARPDTLGYRTSRFIRRHKVAFALGMTSLWLLVAFAVTMTIQAGRIARERDRANRERESAERVSELLVDVFEISDPGEARGNSITAREILDRGAVKVQDGLADQPVIRAGLQDTLGRVYQNLGLFDSATPLLERAYATRRAELGEHHPDTVTTMKNLAWLLERKGDYAAAEPLHREVLYATRGIHGDRDPLVAAAMNNLALLLYHKGDLGGAESLFREALAMYESTGAGESKEAADAKSNLGLVLQSHGDLDAAEALYAEGLEMRRRLLGEDHPGVAVSLDNLGRVKFAREDMDGAERLMREALELRQRVLEPDDPEISTSLNNLASVLFRKGDLAGAEKVFEQLVERDLAKLGDSHPDYGNSLNNLAHIRMRSGDAEGAEPIFREALAVYERGLPPDHWLRALARGNHGECLAALGRHAEAERELMAGYVAMVKALGDDHDRTKKASNRLADFYDRAGRTAEAARYRR